MLKNSSWFLSFCWVTVSFIDFRKIHTFILLYNILIHMLTRLYHLLTLFWSLQQNFTVSYIGPTHYFFYKYMHICIIPCVFLINNRITGNSLAVQCLGFCGTGLIPGQRTKIPHAVRGGQKEKKKNRTEKRNYYTQKPSNSFINLLDRYWTISIFKLLIQNIWYFAYVFVNGNLFKSQKGSKETDFSYFQR